MVCHRGLEMIALGAIDAEGAQYLQRAGIFDALGHRDAQSARYIDDSLHET
jgi:hypothetical protein